MGPLEATKTCLRKYAAFSGRASRAEFWWFQLVAQFAGYIFGFFSVLFGLFGTILAIMVIFGLIIPSLSVTVRRLHDTGRPWFHGLFPFAVFAGIAAIAAFSGGTVSGYLAAMCFVALIGSGIAFFLWLVQPSQPGTNDYGTDPYDPHAEVDITEVFE